MPRLASEKFCTGCLACIDACHQNALSAQHKNGHLFVRINPSVCINCGLCEKTCPIIHPIKRNQAKNIKVYGGWCTLDEYRIKSASGGAFIALALSFFENYKDGIVVGATLKENRVSHLVIRNKSDLYFLQNSKYIQSNTFRIYQTVLKELQARRKVLFSGTPCQIAGLYGLTKARGKNEEKDLYTIELVCHGVANSEALDLHLKYYNSPLILSFRDKKEGQYWYKAERTTLMINGIPRKIERQQDIFYKIFTSWLLDRKSCSNCIYSKIPRVADITIADFWGAPCDEKEFMKGVSLILSNNLSGYALINNSKYLYKFPSSLKRAMDGNPHLYAGFKFIQYHPLVAFPGFFKKILSEKTRLAILTNRMPWKLFWAIYKIPTLLYQKIIKTTTIKKYQL